MRKVVPLPERLVDSYEQVAGYPAHRYTEDFAESRTPVALLAIAGADHHALGQSAAAFPGF